MKRHDAIGDQVIIALRQVIHAVDLYPRIRWKVLV